MRTKGPANSSCVCEEACLPIYSAYDAKTARHFSNQLPIPVSSVMYYMWTFLKFVLDVEIAALFFTPLSSIVV